MEIAGNMVNKTKNHLPPTWSLHSKRESIHQQIYIESSGNKFEGKTQAELGGWEFWELGVMWSQKASHRKHHLSRDLKVQESENES